MWGVSNKSYLVLKSWERTKTDKEWAKVWHLAQKLIASAPLEGASLPSNKCPVADADQIGIESARESSLTDDNAYKFVTTNHVC